MRFAACPVPPVLPGELSARARPAGGKKGNLEPHMSYGLQCKPAQRMF